MYSSTTLGHIRRRDSTQGWTQFDALINKVFLQHRRRTTCQSDSCLVWISRLLQVSRSTLTIKRMLDILEGHDASLVECNFDADYYVKVVELRVCVLYSYLDGILVELNGDQVWLEVEYEY